jgi:L-malate glycosyltransferase
VRVLYFTRDYTPHDHRFLTALAKHGHQVFSLRLERRGMQREDRPLPPDVEQLIWSGGRGPFRWQNLPYLVRDLRRLVREVQPDVVHAGPIPQVGFLAALAGIHPLVSMSWGSDLLLEAAHSRWARMRAQYTLRHTDVMVGDCLAVRDVAVKSGFSSTERVVLFPWGVDLQTFSPQTDLQERDRLGWKDEFVLLSLRSWEPLYGVDLLVRAFLRAARQAPELRLLLLGGGSQAGLIRQMIERAHMEDRVYFGGQIANQQLVRFYRAADLYVSASHSDGSSVSLMEALACGLPVLVSDIPGNKEWISPGKEGWLFPDGNEQALADGILWAVQQREHLLQMSTAARMLAEERADWQKNYLQLERAYQMAVDLCSLGSGRAYAA